jgi:ABC-type sugar transport system permease subunit
MYRRNQARVIVPFLTPALVLYLLFVIYPDVQAFWLSLHRWRGLSKKTYIGLGNYDKMLHDSVFWMALRHNVFFVIVTLVGVTVLALLIAVVLTSRVHGAGFFRTVYFFPSTISIVAIAEPPSGWATNTSCCGRWQSS